MVNKGWGASLYIWGGLVYHFDDDDYDDDYGGDYVIPLGTNTGVLARRLR